jgi:hypothetical protein
MTQSHNNLDIALDNMTEKLLDDVSIDIKEAFDLARMITQSDGLTVGEVIKFLSENLYMDLEVSPDGMTFKASRITIDNFNYDWEV